MHAGSQNPQAGACSGSKLSQGRLPARPLFVLSSGYLVHHLVDSPVAVCRGRLQDGEPSPKARACSGPLQAGRCWPAAQLQPRPASPGSAEGHPDAW